MVIDVPAQAAEAAGAAILEVVETGLAVEERGSSVRLRAYLPEAGFEERYRRLGERWRRVRQAFPAVGPWAPAVRAVDEEDWAEAWKQYFHPLPVGRRLIVVPGWRRAEVDPAGPRVPLVLDPGMAFGTGQHASTRLALELLEEALDAASRRAPASASRAAASATGGGGQREPGRAGSGGGAGREIGGPGAEEPGPGGPGVEKGAGPVPAGARPGEAPEGDPPSPARGPIVLDVGTGSGILAIAAALLGAAGVLAIDIDPVAVRVAAANAAANGVGERVRVARAAPEELVAAPPPEAAGMVPAGITVANITADVLAGMAPALDRLTRPDGVLILSGLLAGAGDTGRLEQVYASRGWRIARRREAEGWAAWWLERGDGPGGAGRGSG